MRLDRVLQGARLRGPLPSPYASLEVRSIEYDSRRVTAGSLFFAFQGRRADGRNFAREARRRGAVAVVSEAPPPEGFDGPWIEVGHGRETMGIACRNLYQDRIRGLQLTGITGTNGKTTTSYLLDSILRAAGRTTALIGTVEYRVAGETLPAENTTPESADLYKIFAKLVERGGSHVTMEVSSHALALGRVFGIEFHCAVFTNLSQDHLDFHGTMEQYFASKQLLFSGCGAPPPGWAVINADDPYGAKLALAATTTALRYGVLSEADLRAAEVRVSAGGLEFELRSREGRWPVRSSLMGLFNVYNILAAWGAARAMGVDPTAAATGIESCTGAPGRFERIDEGQPFTVAVDYAHTDDALRNLILAARSLNPRRVITVFGCGGDRDRSKRPKMGRVAGELSDFVVLTSDNPRSEDPLAIINDVLVGLSRSETPYVADPDRRAAIRKALKMAEAGDIVLLAGKGHETYQILPEGTIHFDDREVARETLRDLGYGRGAR